VWRPRWGLVLYGAPADRPRIRSPLRCDLHRRRARRNHSCVSSTATASPIPRGSSMGSVCVSSRSRCAATCSVNTAPAANGVPAWGSWSGTVPAGSPSTAWIAASNPAARTNSTASVPGRPGTSGAGCSHDLSDDCELGAATGSSWGSARGSTRRARLEADMHGKPGRQRPCNQLALDPLVLSMISSAPQTY